MGELPCWSATSTSFCHGHGTDLVFLEHLILLQGLQRVDFARVDFLDQPDLPECSLADDLDRPKVLETDTCATEAEEAGGSASKLLYP